MMWCGLVRRDGGGVRGLRWVGGDRVAWLLEAGRGVVGDRGCGRGWLWVVVRRG